MLDGEELQQKYLVGSEMKQLVENLKVSYINEYLVLATFDELVANCEFRGARAKVTYAQMITFSDVELIILSDTSYGQSGFFSGIL